MRIGLCKWCDEEERYTPEQLAHLRAEGLLIIPADLDTLE